MSAANLSIANLGIVQAGFASPVEEEFCDIMQLDEYLMRDKNASYLLRMEGDSMLAHGICDGDIIIFERGSDVARGSLAIVLCPDGYRVKVFLADSSSAAASSALSITGDLENMDNLGNMDSDADTAGIVETLIGPVVSIIRKYI